ncbi:MAG: sodium/solute symporter [Terriglobia bacterium]
MHLLDYIIILLYFGIVIFIGIRTKRTVHSSEDFFLSGRSMSVVTTSVAFVAANMGSFELMGAAANGAKYGMFSTQLAWIGCVPAMIFSGMVMVRFFYGSKARSVPEYLRLRFDEKTRALNAISFAFLTIFTSGLSLYGLAIVFHALFDWPIALSIWVSAGTVLAYVTLGGLRASIYTEVLQFFLIVLGIFPLSIMILIQFGGFSGLLSRLPEKMAHTWIPVIHPEGTPYGGGLFSVIVCLGVASCAYWCTDFLVVQRALAAKDMNTAQKTPLLATFPRMLLPFITILPGLAALLVIPEKIQGHYNMVMPLMLLEYYPAGLLGLGMTALLASFMSGMAGNVTAFNTVWTYDIYQSYIAPNRSDLHYLKVGRIVTVAGILISIAAAYTALGFYNIFDYWSLVSTTFLAPPFAIFLLGVFTRKVNGTSAFIGMLTGILASMAHFALYRFGFLHYASDLLMDFYGGFYGFCVSFVVTTGLAFFQQLRRPDGSPMARDLRGLVYWETPRSQDRTQSWYRTPWAMSVAAAALAIVLNIFFW